MIKLVVAVGFLAVFGIVAWASVVLLRDYFKNKEKRNQNQKLN
jgi:hypothetical protein